VEEVVVERSMFEELNTPMDEIRSVVEVIIDILSGGRQVRGNNNNNSTSTSNTSPSSNSNTKPSRGLKSLTPATGTSYNAARQKNAYLQKRKTLLRREKEGVDAKIGRAAGAMSDAAWELRREMEGEENRPGYRSEGVRRGIVAGTVKVANTITGGSIASERRIGGGSRRKKQILKLEEDVLEEEDFRLPPQFEDASYTTDTSSLPPPPPPTMIQRDLTPNDLKSERARLAATLRICLERPDESWLSEDVIDDNDSGERDEDMLLQVITTMLFTRDDMEARASNEDGDGDDASEMGYTQDQVIEELREMERIVESISSLAAASVGYTAAQFLKAQLLGQVDTTAVGDDGDLDGSDGGSLLAGLDQLVEDIETMKLERQKQLQQEYEDAVKKEKEEREEKEANKRQQAVANWENAVRKEEMTKKYSPSDDLPTKLHETIMGDLISDTVDEDDATTMDDRWGVEVEPFLNSQIIDDVVDEIDQGLDTTITAEIVDFPPSMAEVVLDDEDDDESVVTTSVFVPDVISSSQDPRLKSSNSSSKSNNYDNNDNRKQKRKDVRAGTVIETDVEFKVSNSNPTTITTATTILTPDDKTIQDANGSSSTTRTYTTPEVELVLDDEYDDDGGRMENSKSLDDVAYARVIGEYEEEEEKENIFATVMLRAVDVVLFVGEKTLTTGIPTLVNGCNNIATRRDEINREGRGKEGWDLLKHLNKGNKRY